MNARSKNSVKAIAIGFIMPVAFLVAWEILGRRGILNSSIFPTPSRIFTSFMDMVSRGRMQKHLLISLLRVVKGFCVGSVLGLVIGTVIGLSNAANALMSSIIGLLRPIPMVAWIPVLILWLGIDEASKVTLIAIGTFWPVLINTSRGIKNSDRKLLEVGIILEKTRLQMLAKVVLPSAFPFIFTGLRLGVGSAWTCVVTAEAIAAASGIGYLIMYARELSQPPVMFSAVMTIAVVGLILDAILLRVEKRVLRWNEPDEERG
ncbi:MAG: ABC transporter permease [Synergistaceae bacterium]|jgi:sulfonate transport system permease protein|nr:ABC transporter permease [Synergistaceae bacterium]